MEVTMQLPTYIHGEGPSVVLVHGRGEAHETWDPVMPYLQHYRVIRVDLVGFGAAPSPEGAEHYTIESNRVDLAETLAEIKTDGPFALVGHSMGGMIAASYATHHDERLAALVLESTSAAYPYSDEHFPQQHDFMNQLADLAERQGMDGVCTHLGAEHGLGSAMRERLMRMTAHAFAASIRGNASMEDLHGPLATLNTPTLVVAGREDKAFLPWCERLAATVPGAELHILPDVGHGPHGESPEVFGERLRAFLETYLRP
jgi:2-succinyl-6-hydroxy-2,4-cyclohexadiene-1-carboxylate synthase